jgi:hypothetical protein
MDKVKILLTPDVADLMSPKGIQQVQKIGQHQLEYYQHNKWFATRQAVQVTMNAGEIARRVKEYAEKYGSDPKQIWKLVQSWISE